MIRGKFLTSMDDTSTVLDLRYRVFCDEQGFPREKERDAYDDMSVYALVYDENDQPAGTGRLYIDASDHFAIGRVCVLGSARGQGLGDLVMRMLLYRAQELSASAVYISAQTRVVPFYQRYGFVPCGDVYDDDGVPHRLLCVAGDAINLEGKCKSQKPCANCQNNCETCEAANRPE